MQVIHASLVLSVMLTLCLFTSVLAQQTAGTTMALEGQAGRVESMRMLTPEVGWAASTGSHLFWTTDGGRRWRDITPGGAKPENITAVFFLNRSTGWMLFTGGGNDDRPRFHLAATTDAGMHWTVAHVNTSGLTPPEATLTGNGYMYFLDSVHGWINLSVASGSAFHPGAALATQDGGKTWNWVPMGSGSAGRIFFRTLKDGWIISPDRAELDVTHDGSKSWQEVSLQALPPHAADVSGSGYDLPSFEDDLHGFLMASFPDLDQLVLFSTDDGGQTWKRVRPLPRVEAAAIIVEHSTWIAASIPLHSRTLTLTTLSLDKASSQPADVKADIGHIPDTHAPGADGDYLDFIDDTHGWVLAGELLSTSDGGVTWTDITPPTA